MPAFNGINNRFLLRIFIVPWQANGTIANISYA